MIASVSERATGIESECHDLGALVRTALRVGLVGELEGGFHAHGPEHRSCEAGVGDECLVDLVVLNDTKSAAVGLFIDFDVTKVHASTVLVTR